MNLDTEVNRGLSIAGAFSHNPAVTKQCIVNVDGRQIPNMDIYDQQLQEVDPTALRELLKKTRTLNTILTIIAGRLEITDPYNEKVVKAYILGEESVLNPIPTEEEKGMLVKVWVKGTKPELMNSHQLDSYELKADLLNSFHHTSLIIATALVDPWQRDKVAKAINICGIRYGHVVAVVDNRVDVEVSYFRQVDHAINIEFPTQRFSLEAWAGEVRKGDPVVVHRGIITEKLTEKELADLDRNTRVILERHNQYVFSHSRKDKKN